MPHELLGFLKPYPDHVSIQMIEGRDILLKILAPVSDLIYDATAAVCIGFSFTDDLRGLFVNLAAYAEHVTLVFAWGSQLDDPHRRLSGSGSRVRHIRLTSVDTLHEATIQDLILQSANLAVKPTSPIAPQTVFKVYNGQKRRPKNNL